MSYITLKNSLPLKEYEFNSKYFPSFPFTCPGCSIFLVVGNQVWVDFVDSIIHNSDYSKILICGHCARTKSTPDLRITIQKIIDSGVPTTSHNTVNYGVWNMDKPDKVDKPNTMVMVSVARQCEVCFGKGRDTKEFKICKHCYGRGKIWEEKEQNGIT